MLVMFCSTFLDLGMFNVIVVLFWLIHFWITCANASLLCLIGNHYNVTLNQFAVAQKHIQRDFTNFTVLCLQKYCYLQRYARSILVLFCSVFLDLGTLNVSPLFQMVGTIDWFSFTGFSNLIRVLFLYSPDLSRTE